jgi:putative SOS response-associated peptidase YedK
VRCSKLAGTAAINHGSKGSVRGCSSNGFYEWRGQKPPKTPFFVYLKSQDLFSLGGLWNTWKKPDGTILESFAIITTPPNELMRPIHRRMPLILHRDDEEKWLNCSANPFDNVQALVKPFPSEQMEAHEISNSSTIRTTRPPVALSRLERQPSLGLQWG